MASGPHRHRWPARMNPDERGPCTICGARQIKVSGRWTPAEEVESYEARLEALPFALLREVARGDKTLEQAEREMVV